MSEYLVWGRLLGEARVTTATMRLIEAVERLNMTGEIGDGMVAHLHDLAAGARLEQVGALAGYPEFAACEHPPEAIFRAPDAAGLVVECGACGARASYPGFERARCSHVFHQHPQMAVWSTCPSCGRP